MSRIFLAVPALALAVFLSGSAQAADGIPSDSTLKAMGLAGIQVMSDADAMAIRGLGRSPLSRAWGESWASVGKKKGNDPNARTYDGFKARGKYMASGSHFSEAFIEEINKKVKNVNGNKITKTKTHSVYVFAGGNAMSSSL